MTDEKIPSVNFAFKLTTPFESIVLAATTAEDRAAWKFAISNAIEFAQYSLRGYMIKKGSYLEGSPRKFFVLHNSILSMHQDHEHTAVSQWAIEITEETEIIAKDDKLQIKVSEGYESVKMVFDKKNANEYIKWKEALFEHITRFTKMKEKEMAEVDAVLDKASINGNLQIRPAEGGDVWPEYQVALTETSLVLIQSFDDGNHFKVTDTFIITKDCKCIETHLKQFAFQVVTAERILHCAAQTKPIADYWMASIMSKIKVSVAEDPNDHLFKLAMTRISNDKYYDVTFNEAKPLGIVLEKVGEWALVKISNFKETGVKVGSALCAINGESVLYEKYSETVEKLKNWTPPLTLQFRQAPEKKGYLLKKSNKRGKDTSWNRRWFVLGEGKLGFYNSDSSFARLVMEMSLFGATISQVPRETYGKFYAFKVLSGIHSFTIEAADITELREWTSIIYHAIAFANGGSYIVEYELEKQKQEAEMARALLEQQEAIAADEYRSQLFENVRLAVEARVLDWLEEAIKAAEDNDLMGEYIDFAKKVLEELREEARQAEEDAKLNAAAAAYEAEQERLAREAAALEAQLGPEGTGPDDDDDVDDTRANQVKGGSLARNGSLAHRKTRMAVALKPAAAAAAQVASIAEDDEDEEDEDEEEGMDDGTANSAARMRKRGVVTEEVSSSVL